MPPSGTKAPARSGYAATAVITGNAAYEWDKFDPHWYVRKNYLEFRDDDRRILQLMRDFFAREVDPAHPVSNGIDVGSGANLYPTLAMLPFCRELTLWERGQRNVNWLNAEVQGFSSVWEPYWTVLTSRDPYARVDDPRAALRAKAGVVKGDLFKLPRRAWSMGTMSFVAESISDQRREFNAATERFLGSLKPGAPFAAAFMRESSGYYVDSERFPAVAIREADVQQCLLPLTDDFEIKTIRSERPLRDGVAMILALGKAGRKRS